MGFYIRKALLTGPVRVNLSKGGLGFSAGVTGARVGVNRQGVYVHGGRGGLYYRKYMKKGAGAGDGGRGTVGSSTGASARASAGTMRVADSLGQTVTHFQDTGVTLARPLAVDMGGEGSDGSGSQGSVVQGSAVHGSTVHGSTVQGSISRTGVPNRTTKTSMRQATLEREDPLLNKRNLLLFAGSFFALFVSLLANSRIFVLITGVLFLAVLGFSLYQYYWRSVATKRFHTLTGLLEKDLRFPPVGDLPQKIGSHEVLPEKIPEKWRYLLAFRLHAVGCEVAMRNERIHIADTLAWLDEHVPLSTNRVSEIRISVLMELLQEMLEDHLLSEEENRAMTRLIQEAGVSKEKLKPLHRTMDAYNLLREEIQRPLLETSAGIPLFRGEVAYEVFDKVRIVKERVFDRFQRDGVQHRVMGYDIQSEGKFVITDRRFVLVGRGSREYRLNQLLDITTDPEAGVIELTMNKRKSPIILTTENLMLLSARLERVHQMIMNQSAT